MRKLSSYDLWINEFGMWKANKKKKRILKLVVNVNSRLEEEN